MERENHGQLTPEASEALGQLREACEGRSPGELMSQAIHIFADFVAGKYHLTIEDEAVAEAYSEVMRPSRIAVGDVIDAGNRVIGKRTLLG